MNDCVGTIHRFKTYIYVLYRSIEWLETLYNLLIHKHFAIYTYWSSLGQQFQEPYMSPHIYARIYFLCQLSNCSRQHATTMASMNEKSDPHLSVKQT